MRARIPPSIRELLTEAIGILDKGPSSSLATLGQSEEYRRGYEAAMRDNRGWRETHILPPLRRLLCYLDGAASAREVLEYGHGYSYGEKK